MAGCIPSGPEERTLSPVMTVEAFLKFLKSRQGLLDGVCVSGGEPTLRPELPELLRSINDKDYNVDVSTSSINRAQTRMNRRAGTTIVPVGT